MSQAAVDMPDPIDQQPPVAAGEADDLLSQMAGEQIDRMLAESENDSPENLGEQSAALIVAGESIGTQINAVLDPIVSIEAPPPAQPAAAPAIQVQAPSLDHAIDPKKIPTVSVDQVVAALNEIPAVIETVEPANDRQSFLVRILELINAPFAAVPDGTRDLLGKLAILTLLNSIGVILYVLLFRR